MSVEYIQLLPGAKFPRITENGPFRAVVIIEEDVTPEWQASVCTWLVQSGCLYMMAWGKSCSSWDDSVDHANMKEFAFGEIPESKFVMTTWHTDDPLNEVFWFSKNNADHPSVELERSLLVHISSRNKSEELLRAYADV
ncbi:MAG: hypothetical protein IT389_09895 [Nitrospira sp.]|nr:hypothetical protein [Nitrospira sp.]